MAMYTRAHSHTQNDKLTRRHNEHGCLINYLLRLSDSNDRFSKWKANKTQFDCVADRSRRKAADIHLHTGFITIVKAWRWCSGSLNSAYCLVCFLSCSETTKTDWKVHIAAALLQKRDWPNKRAHESLSTYENKEPWMYAQKTTE